jgi:uncharacterized protein YigE (DUF2233 family)
MLSCNGMDRGLNVTPPERAPTSAWSLVIREPVEPTLHPEGDKRSPRKGIGLFSEGINLRRQASENVNADVCGLCRPE